MWRVALRENSDLLLDVLNLVLCLLQVNDLHGDNLLGPVVKTAHKRGEMVSHFTQFEYAGHFLQ